MMRRRGWIVLVLVLVWTLAPGSQVPRRGGPGPAVAEAAICTPPTQTLPQVRLQQVVSGLASPVQVTHARDLGRLFVVEQGGKIRIIKGGVLLATPFLDISSKVILGGETGLLSVAFHPSYATNGRFFVSYTESSGALRNVVAEYHVSTNPDVADPTETVILKVDQPFNNHNGGLILFGPDGFLYIGRGDGGGSGDPLNNGQNIETLLGKILRINVNGAPPYTIPADNPFVGVAGRDEIWAYGLRNPWRFSFDPCTSRLLAGDVGQDTWEEIDLIVKGRNYGWRIMEGAHCFNPPSGCNPTGLELPIQEYNHSLGCSVTGGHVYRGLRIPNLRGRYVFGDLCSGRIWAMTEGAGGVWTSTQLLQAAVTISSFGEDARGELYVVDYSGTIYGISVSDSVGLYDGTPSTFFLRNANTTGVGDVTPFTFGVAGAGWMSVTGDWDGNGTHTMGLYDSSTGRFFLRNSNTAGPADVTPFAFGPVAPGWMPVAGDWDGDGDDTIGLYNSGAGMFFLRNSNTGGPADLTFSYGPAGVTWTPLAGDWDGDGDDTVGLYNPATATFFLRNSNSSGPADVAPFVYGPAGMGWRPIAGDWDGIGTESVGLYKPATSTFFLRNTHMAGPADVPPFVFGPAGAGWLPLAGDWDGF